VKTVNIHEAKTNLSRLVQEALDGEEIVIAKGNVPLVRLEVVSSARKQRTLGFAESAVVMREDFDEPLTDFDGYQ
jgi:antitoxin (DNA-binding transcriptional repressor) of toxin-antitoxin stability system